MKEMWKDIPDWEGFYQASNRGNIRSLDRTVAHRGCKMKRAYYGKTMSSKTNGTGYLQVELNRSGEKCLKYVHRLVLSAFAGYSSLDVDHINGDRSDNRLSNLQYVTVRENQSKRKLGKVLPVGVTHCRNKYRAIIFIDGRNWHLGYFDTISKAELAYKTKLNSISA